jgi:hypothetical protein
MKNQNRNFLLLIVLLTIVMSSISCKKKCNEISALTFTSKEIKLIPYYGTVTLNESRDGVELTDSYQGTRKDENNTITENSNSGIDNQGCNGDYYSVEYNWINLVTTLSTSAMEITVDLEFDNPFTTKGINKYLNIAIGATYGPSGLFYHRIPLKNEAIELNDSTVFYYATPLC